MTWLPKQRWTHKRMETNATLELCTVDMNTWMWTLTLIHTLSVLLFLSLHLLSSNFVLIHLIISSIILPPPSHLSALHECLFIYPFTPLPLTSPSWTHSLSPCFFLFSFINLPFSVSFHFLFIFFTFCLSQLLLYFLYHLFSFSVMFLLPFSAGTYSLHFAWAAVAPWAHVLLQTSQERVSCCITPRTMASPGRCCSTTLTKASTSQGSSSVSSVCVHVMCVCRPAHACMPMIPLRPYNSINTHIYAANGVLEV